MKRRGRRLISAVLCFAVGATACLSSIAFAESNAPEGDYIETSILTVTGDDLISTNHEVDSDGNYGYLQTNMDTDTLESNYLAVSYKLGDDVTVTDDLQVFNLQPFNTSWGGWDDNYITVGESDYDSSTGVYTGYIATAKVGQSLSSGTLYGINLSFAAVGQTSEITLVDYKILTENEVSNETEHQLDAEKLILNITGTDLVNAGYDYDTLQALIKSNSGKVKFYVHMTAADEYSWLHSRSGSVNNFNGNAEDTVPGSGKGASNKYLVAPSCTVWPDSTYPIHISSDGTPVGNAGTGNYVFPDNSITYNKITTVENYSLSVGIGTDHTEAEVLGLVFSDGTSFSVSYNEDGNVTLTKGFEVPDNLESTEDESEDAKTWPWEQDAAKRKSNLKLSLDYIAKMDSSKYTAESWADLEAAVEVAEAEYNNSSATADSLKKARDTLENVKAKLIFDTETDDSNAQPFRELSAEETIAEMGVGTNLGNTMDGHSGLTPSETAWQCAVTTKEYIKALHDAGYNTVRVPVTWGNMINSDYSVNETWLSRVQDIVDYCVEQDMYCIINMHHDDVLTANGWFDMGADDIDSIMEKYEGLWRTIAERFKDYDEHLIFEAMNEVSCAQTSESLKNSSEAANYDTPIIVNFNQLFVNTVRSTGSNNTKRWLANVSHYANNGSSSLFTMADDSYYNSTNRQMFALHIYSDTTGVIDRLKAVKKKFSDKGIPVYLGEYGRTLAEDSTTESGYNDIWRGWYSEVVGRACQVAGVVPCVWDQGFGTKGEYETGLYSYWNRIECRPIFKSTIDKMVRGTFSDVTSANESWNFSDIDEGYNTTEATSITPSAEKVEMTIGDYTTLTATAEPSDTNDVILWSTDDDKIATVYNGQIHAKGIGKTTVHVYSQSGSVSKDIEVIVGAKDSDEEVAITTDSEEYSVVQSKGVFIDAEAFNGGTLTYESSNNDILTVDDLGKVVGIDLGEAYVIITAGTGETKTVKVTVTDASTSDEITLGLMVLYNDSTHTYYGTERGSTVTVNGDGTYTLSFDCSTDLSSKATAAGIKNLSNLTSIYIKDVAVMDGEAMASPLDSSYIVYDKIVMDGVEYEINDSGKTAKSALKSKTFDSGNPINSYDGSVIDEVTVSSYVLNFTTATAPTSFEVTFTLSDTKFTEAEATRDNPATALEAVTDTDITICPNSDVDTIDITVSESPSDTDTLVSFVSSDKSIAQVSQTAVENEDGSVTATVELIDKGDVTITAMTENGYTVEFNITSDHSYGDWTDSDDGETHYRTCTECDYTETADHEWGVGVVTKDPEIGVEGEKTYTCTDCGAEKTEAVPALEPDTEEQTTEPEETTDEATTDEATTDEVTTDEATTAEATTDEATTAEATTESDTTAATEAEDTTADTTASATAAATTAASTTVAQSTTAAAATAASSGETTTAATNTGAEAALSVTLFMTTALCGAIAIKRRRK